MLLGQTVGLFCQVQQAQQEGINVSGPFPPDTIFLSGRDGIYDAIVTMYHDQGHIPMKLLAFDSGVNMTIGLPIIRTSVDHGTAYDLAGRGTASDESLTEAILLAASLARHRKRSAP